MNSQKDLKENQMEKKLREAANFLRTRRLRNEKSASDPTVDILAEIANISYRDWYGVSTKWVEIPRQDKVKSII